MVRRLGVAAVLPLVAMAAVAMAAALAPWPVAAQQSGLALSESDRARLGVALSRLDEVAQQGGWPAIPDGPALRPGDRGERVAALRRRLAVTDGAPARVADGALFDRELEAAVRRAQLRHGLDVDGVVGRATLAALNVPAADRVRQIGISLERWQDLPRELGDPYIVVNAAAFELTVVEDGQVRLSMPVIVGRPDRQTPEFSAAVTHFIVNPDWTVPTRLAARELLPRIRRDPAYLRREGFELYESWAPGARQLDPAAIDWTRVGRAGFPYKLRQLPGPTNALGRIKFVLASPFDIYLHDTPQRALFDRPVRAFSNGCIRLADPFALADFAMRGDPGWTAERRDALLAAGDGRRVDLARPINVHFVYFTAWAELDGTMQFRDDIYGRDRAAAARSAQVAAAGPERFCGPGGHEAG